MTKAKATVYIKGPHFYGLTRSAYNSLDKYKIVYNIKDADIVSFTGGEDINPVLYGEKAINGTYFNTTRDRQELDCLGEAIGLNKFLVGICRGAQLLNVIPNKGKLWQDVNNHGSTVHKSWDCLTGSWVYLNSVHHQMMRPGPDAELVCWTDVSTRRESEGSIWKKDPSAVLTEANKDVEVLWYAKTKSLLMQSHPEFDSRNGSEDTCNYFGRLMDNYFFNEAKGSVDCAA